jgi:hypothetical protein
MPLTKAEKACGRWWRDEVAQVVLDALNTANPPDVSPPPFIRHIRHECPAAGGRSTSFDYAEVYVTSPRLAVCYCSEVQIITAESLRNFPHDDCQGGVFTEAGRLGWIYHEGKCAGCGFSARSAAGRVVDAQVRLPAGRIVKHG